MALTGKEIITDRLVEIFKDEFDISKAEVSNASGKAWDELLASREDIKKKGRNFYLSYPIDERKLCKGFMV